MPWGRYPDKVRAFRKWSTERVDKANINNSATAAKRRSRLRRKNRRRKKD